MILLGNSLTYENEAFPTTKESYIENIRGLSELCVNVLDVRDVRKDPLSFLLKCIKRTDGN